MFTNSAATQSLNGNRSEAAVIYTERGSNNKMMTYV